MKWEESVLPFAQEYQILTDDPAHTGCWTSPYSKPPPGFKTVTSGCLHVQVAKEAPSATGERQTTADVEYGHPAAPFARERAHGVARPGVTQTDPPR